MTEWDTTARWHDPSWLAEVRQWVEERLAIRGVSIDGEIEQPHVQWWSTALRIPTTAGVMWFKATREVHEFEPALMMLLSGLMPEHVAEPVAVDEGRQWMLTRDAGTRLREAVPGREQLDRWVELLPLYAEVQRELAVRAPELLALGVADHRLVSMPTQLRAALDDHEVLLIGDEDGLTESEHGSLLDALPDFDRLCSALATLGVPETIQHDDLHDGNAYVRNGEYVFFDWGDASISHPFHTLTVTLRVLAYRFGLEPGGPEITRLLDAYLEPWTGAAPRRELTAAADLARRTGPVQRALAWHRFVSQMPPKERAENMDAVPYGLKLYLSDAPWGAWQ